MVIGDKNPTICVNISVLDDPRICYTVGSLNHQTVKPDMVLIAYGGGNPIVVRELKEELKRNFPSLNIITIACPGTPIQSKINALNYIDTDITAYLDADELAPETWLEHLTEPINTGRADYTGGPTKQIGEAKSGPERYYNELERRIYEGDVKQDVTYMPLGNTAWRTSLLKELRFDSRITFRGGAPDYDLEMRAVDAGYKGEFVREAWVYHDKSTDKGYMALLRHRYKYLVGAAVIMIKNRRLGRRLGEKRIRIKHPFVYVEMAMKPLALIHAALLWQILKRREMHL